MNQSRASSIFISFTRATLFILCLRTPPALSMNPQRPGHRRHRSQIIHDISTDTVIINSGSSKSSVKKAEKVTIESWSGSPGKAPRGIVFIQAVPEDESLPSQPSSAQIRENPIEPASEAVQVSQRKKLRRRNALSRSHLVRPLGSPRITHAKRDLTDTSGTQDVTPEELGAPAELDNAPRKPSLLAQFCCYYCACASPRKVQPSSE